MKRYRDFVPTVKVIKFLEMVNEKLEKVSFNDTFVEIVITDLVKHQFYQQVKTILLSVKYALS